MRPDRPTRRLLAVALAATLLGGAGQEPGEPAADLEALRAGYERARVLFESAEQPRSIPLFGELIDRIEPLVAAEPEASELRELLTASLFRRAEAHFNLGEDGPARADLGRLLRTEPGFEADAARVSPKLLELLDAARAETVGFLVVRISPPDARISIDGRATVPSQGRLALVEGVHAVDVTRPGHEPLEEWIDVAPGVGIDFERELPRVSAAVTLPVQPAGTTVLVDGVVVEPSVAPPAATEGGAAAEGSEVLTVDGLRPGSHTLEIRKPGYGTWTGAVEIAALEDYLLPAVTLREARGTLALSRLPAGASVTLDGETLDAERIGHGAVELSLPAGEHSLTVTRGGAGRFDRAFTLGHGERLQVEVELRPMLVLAGVLGGDRGAAAALRERIAGCAAGLDDFTYDDRSAAGEAALARTGVSADRLRPLASLGAEGGGAAEWTTAQRVLDEAANGSLYLLVVLSDDLFAESADFWVWAAAPAPPRPALRRVTVREGGSAAGTLEELCAELRAPRFERAWLGARVADSALAEGPVVLSVTPGSPAAGVGIAPGDVIRRLDGAPVGSSRDLIAGLAARGAGRIVELDVRSAARSRLVDLELGSSPAVLAGRRDLLQPVVWASLAAASILEPPPAPLWVLRLNQAAILMRHGAWREAVETLREIQAPTEVGLGQATVDYWLAVALLEVDAAAYREGAERALERAAAVPGARFDHHDGPLVATRARARLAALRAM